MLTFIQVFRRLQQPSLNQFFQQIQPKLQTAQTIAMACCYGWLLLSALLLSNMAIASPPTDPKVVLVSIDGLRWQEVFYGADHQIAADSRFVKDRKKLQPLLEGARASQLMPFFHQTIAKQGLLVGDRRRGSLMNVTNQWHISYPGYNEMLSGMADPKLHSNAKIANPNITVLEWLNHQAGMQGQVAAFGSWDVLPYILNVARSGLPVNAGFAEATGSLSPKLQLLNQLQRQTPSPWPAVRHDVFTQQFALDYLQTKKPKLLYVAFGETDDFAHDQRYDQYLAAAQRADSFIAELWQQLQADPFYRNQTTLIITTDHGRGDSSANWSFHAGARSLQQQLTGYLKPLAKLSQGITGSDQIWLAALGPQIPARGLVRTDSPWLQSQVASTVAELLGYDFQSFQYKASTALPLQDQQVRQLAARQLTTGRSFAQ